MSVFLTNFVYINIHGRSKIDLAFFEKFNVICSALVFLYLKKPVLFPQSRFGEEAGADRKVGCLEWLPRRPLQK